MASSTSYPPIVHHPSTSHRLSTSDAREFLTTFLHLANIDPAYRPDSTLTERGPQSVSSVGNPNLTLHHLNRIKLGLEGTSLGVEDLDADFFGQDKKKAAPSGNEERGEENRKRKRQEQEAGYTSMRAGMPEVISTAEEDVDAMLTAQNTVHAREPADGGEGWQDPEAFELAQGDEDVDANIAQRDPAGAEVEEMDAGILEGETGRILNVDEELEKEEGAAQAIRTGDVIDEHQAEGKRNGVSTVLSKEAKAERKKLKKLRSKEENRTRNTVKSKQAHVEPSRRPDKNHEEVEEKTRLKKKKKKSKVEG